MFATETFLFLPFWRLFHHISIYSPRIKHVNGNPPVNCAFSSQPRLSTRSYTHWIRSFCIKSIYLWYFLLVKQPFYVHNKMCFFCFCGLSEYIPIRWWIMMNLPIQLIEASTTQFGRVSSVAARHRSQRSSSSPCRCWPNTRTGLKEKRAFP